MNDVFTIGDWFSIPDGTKLSPFMNSQDLLSDLPWNLVEGFSLSAGKIDPQTKSKIHIMPLVTQATFVLNGELQIKMKEPDSDIYCLDLHANEAVLTRPCTFFQLINDTDALAYTFYIVSPAYLFDFSVKGDGDMEPTYDDSACFDEGWEELAKMEWAHPVIGEITQDKRYKAGLRIAVKKKEKSMQGVTDPSSSK